MSDPNRWEKGPRLIAKGQQGRHDPTWVEDLLSASPGRKPNAKAERELLKLMASVKPDNLRGVKVYSGDIDPRQLYRDIRENPRTSLVGKAVGHVTHLPLLLAGSGDLRAGGPFYDPFSDSIYSPWDAPGATMHELGHAIDFNRGGIPKTWLGRQAKGLTRDAYTMTPLMTLIKEHRAWNEGRNAYEEGAARKGKTWRDVKRVITSEAHSKYPALGSYWGGAAGLTGAAGMLYAATQQKDNTRGNIMARLALVPLLAGPLLGLGAGTLMRNRKEKELVADGRKRYLQRRQDLKAAVAPPVWKAAMTMTPEEQAEFAAAYKPDDQIMNEQLAQADFDRLTRNQATADAEVERRGNLSWGGKLQQGVSDVWNDPEKIPSVVGREVGRGLPFMAKVPFQGARGTKPGLFSGPMMLMQGVGGVLEHGINSVRQGYIDPINKARALKQQLAGGTPAEILAQMDPAEVAKHGWNEGKIKHLQGKGVTDLAFDYYKDDGRKLWAPDGGMTEQFARDYLPDSWTAGGQSHGKTVPTMNLDSDTGQFTGADDAAFMAQTALPGDGAVRTGARGLASAAMGPVMGVQNSFRRAAHSFDSNKWQNKPVTHIVNAPVVDPATGKTVYHTPQQLEAPRYRSIMGGGAATQAYQQERMDNLRFEQAPGTVGQKLLATGRNGLPLHSRHTQERPELRRGKDQYGNLQAQRLNPAYDGDKTPNIPEYVPVKPPAAKPVVTPPVYTPSPHVAAR